MLHTVCMPKKAVCLVPTSAFLQEILILSRSYCCEMLIVAGASGSREHCAPEGAG